MMGKQRSHRRRQARIGRSCEAIAAAAVPASHWIRARVTPDPDRVGGLASVVCRLQWPCTCGATLTAGSGDIPWHGEALLSCGSCARLWQYRARFELRAVVLRPGAHAADIQVRFSGSAPGARSRTVGVGFVGSDRFGAWALESDGWWLVGEVHRSTPDGGSEPGSTRVVGAEVPVWREAFDPLVALDDSFWLERSVLTDGWAFAGQHVRDNPNVATTESQIDALIDAQIANRMGRFLALLARYPADANAIRAAWDASWAELRVTCRPRTRRGVTEDS